MSVSFLYAMKKRSTPVISTAGASGDEDLYKPHFFRPLLPGFRRRLDIPDEFMRTYLKDELQRKSRNIKNNNGSLPVVLGNGNREWVVYLRGRILEKGWPEFINEYYSCFDKDEDNEMMKLNVGDFLVFRHEGNLVFHVTVFDVSTGFEKPPNPYPSISSTSTSKKKKKKISHAEKKEKVDLTNCPCFDSECQLSTIKKKKLYIPVKFFKENGLDRSCEMILKNEKGVLWEVKAVYYGKIPSLYIAEGWNDFQIDNGLKLGDRFRFYLIKNAQKPILLFSSPYYLVD